MESALKTKDVSRILGVNPTTIQRWVKFFNLPCQKNEHGHYLFTEQHIAQLKMIKEQLDQGLPMSKVKLSASDEPKYKVEDVIKKFNHMTKRIENIEYRLEEKATNVVNIQLLQHRRELEKLHQLVENMKHDIQQVKKHIEKRESEESHQPQKNQKKWFSNLLSFL